MSTHTCEHCKTIFKPGPGAKGRYCSKPCQHQGMALINKRLGEERQRNNPRPRCTHCDQPITGKFGKIYCSRSCSAKASNATRAPMSLQTKHNISLTLREKSKPDISQGFHNISLKRMKKLFVVGPYTPVYKNTCIKTNKTFYSKSYQKYHPTVIQDRQHYAYLCKFKFSISQFPEWFDSELIRNHGWYSTPGSRTGQRNLNGVSRDHRLSIDYGFRNNIPPAIIRHPANCELVLHRKNQEKNSKSSITYAQLLEDIKTFQTIYSNWQE